MFLIYMEKEKWFNGEFMEKDICFPISLKLFINLKVLIVYTIFC